MNPDADVRVRVSSDARTPKLAMSAPTAVLTPPAPDDLPTGVAGPVAGAILFARYAYPPNELGYCGPADHRALLGYGAAGRVDGGLVQLARGFAGAWPYLELIAGEAGMADPLDHRVVEAYWLGTPLLDGIDMQTFGNSLLERFRRRAGAQWNFMAEAIPVGAVPCHSFHVFGVYPWVGLLGSDRGDTPLLILDRCRIRWGHVVSVDGDLANVLSRPLTFENGVLGVGEPRLETARLASDGTGFLERIRPGDLVSMHWDWICDRLSRRQAAQLRHSTLRQLDITNRRVVHSGPRAVLG